MSATLKIKNPILHFKKSSSIHSYQHVLPTPSVRGSCETGVCGTSIDTVIFSPYVRYQSIV